MLLMLTLKSECLLGHGTTQQNIMMLLVLVEPKAVFHRFLKNSFSKKFCKIHVKRPVQELYF